VTGYGLSVNLQPLIPTLVPKWGEGATVLVARGTASTHS
jgi:hypothetical protein